MENTYVIFDLEATCWDQQNLDPDVDNIYKQRNEMETIEIGAVKTDFNFNIIDEFQIFVRPILNPILSDFCKQLTTITQTDVCNAPYFKEAYSKWVQWANKPSHYIAWGQYDYNQLKQDCERSNLNLFASDKYINGKFLIQGLRGFPGKGLGAEVSRYNLDFEGTQHRGICDARMISKVLKAALKNNQGGDYENTV